MAAVGLDRCRVNAFRLKTLKIRMHRLVLPSEDEQARLRLPGNLVELPLLEQVGSGWVVGRPNQLLLLLGKVSREVLDAFRLNPDTSAGDLDLGEDFGGVFVQLALHGLPNIRDDSGDVNQCRDALVGSGSRDGGSAVRVTDEDRVAVDPTQSALHCGHVIRVVVEPVLDGDHFVPIGLGLSHPKPPQSATGRRPT